MLRVDLDLDGLLSRVDSLREVVDRAIHPAAQKGAQVYYDEVRARAISIGHSQQLQNSIYQKFVVRESNTGKVTFHVSWRKQRNAVNVKMRAPEQLPYTTIGYWIEYGYIQRYASYVGKDGNWYTAVRSDKQGTPAPGRKASQSTKDAYYVPRPGGPVQWLPRSFLRSSYEAKKSLAAQAAINEIQKHIAEAKL